MREGSGHHGDAGRSVNIRVGWIWESWHSSQEHVVNDLVRKSNDSLMMTCNDVNVIPFTQKTDKSWTLCAFRGRMEPTNKHRSNKSMFFFFTSALVMSDLLPAVTGCSWLVVECAPVDTEGLNTRLLQTWYLGQGGILSFGSVDSVRAFASTLHRFCSVLLKVVVWAGWTSALANQVFFCSSELWPGRPGGVVEGQQNSGST